MINYEYRGYDIRIDYNIGHFTGTPYYDVWVNGEDYENHIIVIYWEDGEEELVNYVNSAFIDYIAAEEVEDYDLSWQ